MIPNTATLYEMLSRQPMSSAAICEATGWSYRTARRALENLLDQGLAKRVGNVNRGFLYGIAS